MSTPLKTDPVSSPGFWCLPQRAGLVVQQGFRGPGGALQLRPDETVALLLVDDHRDGSHTGQTHHIEGCQQQGQADPKPVEAPGRLQMCRLRPLLTPAAGIGAAET
ncbi:hypothetical protein ACWCSH_40995 [Streptosporangium sp. NPDC001682]